MTPRRQRRPAHRAAALLASALVAAPLVLASAGPGQAQFYWPWQTRPAPPPPAPPPPAVLRAPRFVPRAAAPRAPTAKPSAARQDDGKSDKGQKAEQPPAPEPPPPPYEPQLLRLSEILGALAFLRPLCGGSDGETFRTRMATLLDAEASTQTRRERLAGAYNKGYREYAQVYRRCTPAAELVIDRYAGEGGKLSRELTGRFGG